MPQTDFENAGIHSCLKQTSKMQAYIHASNRLLKCHTSIRGF